MPSKKKPSAFATRAIHAGQEPDPVTGAVVTPLYLTSTYKLEKFGRYKDGIYDYARTVNLTRSACEANLASLEGGRFACGFASGMAAAMALMSLCKQGDHVIVSHNVYGGTYRLFEQVVRDFGLDFSFVDTSDTKQVLAAAKPNTRLLFVETPTNPLLTLSDIRALSKIAKKRKWVFTVDNTFATPWNQQPLSLGADIVLHSTTKFLNGHSDSIGGILITSDKKIHERLAFVQNSAGAILSPMDAWLILRGTKTLDVRMERHEKSSRKIAAFLDKSRKLKKVFYPGLRHHPQYALVKRQMRGFGALITFETGSRARAQKFLNGLSLCTLAESLGGVETLISHPVTMTHGSVPKAERRKLGITGGLVRISVGLEDVDDLIADLKTGLASL